MPELRALWKEPTYLWSLRDIAFQRSVSSSTGPEVRVWKPERGPVRVAVGTKGARTDSELWGVGWQPVVTVWVWGGRRGWAGMPSHIYLGNVGTSPPPERGSRRHWFCWNAVDHTVSWMVVCPLGRMICPRSNPWNRQGDLIWKKAFADVSKSRLLRWDHPGFRCTPIPMTGVLEERQKEIWDTGRGEGLVKMEAEVGFIVATAKEHLGT